MKTHMIKQLSAGSAVRAPQDVAKSNSTSLSLSYLTCTMGLLTRAATVKCCEDKTVLIKKPGIEKAKF